MQGMQGQHSEMLQKIDQGRSIVKKFGDNFFVKEMMEKGGESQDEVLKQAGHSEETKQMDKSFYRKEGLDYLYFQRPGTAYERDISQNSQMGNTTRMNFFDPTGKSTKPFEMLGSKNKSLVFQIWFARAEKVLKQLDHIKMLLDFFEKCTVLANRFQEYL